jgi:hypothetical protein
VPTTTGTADQPTQDGETQRLTILRRPLPGGPGTALFYRCNWCQKPCRYRYLLTLSGTKLVSDLGLRCKACARLRFGLQGQYRSAFSRLFGARPRASYPQDAGQDQADGALGVQGQRDGRDLGRDPGQRSRLAARGGSSGAGSVA